MTDPWLTVVTVVKDAPDDLARTVASMAAQDRTGVDYVIVDSSRDREGVTSIASSVPSTVVWTAPTGIYPAMNIGLEHAQGEYTYFLNAGDSLHDPGVLADVHSALRAKPDWAFGPVEIIDLRGGHTVTPPWDYHREQRTGFSTGHFPPHQGTFARTQLLRQLGGFDPSYRIAADYAMFLKMSRVSDPLELPRIIATFIEGGASTTDWRESFREFRRARSRILDVRGAHALWMHWNAAWHFGTVYAARELRR